MPTFTEGKWKAFYGEEFHTVRQAYADDDDGHDYGNGQLIAHIVQWHDGHDWANARLIAAAPQMYNLLKAVEYDLHAMPHRLANDISVLLNCIDGKENNNA